MKNFIKNFKKNEKGSITVFVLASMILMLGIITITFYTLNNKLLSQEKDIDKIKKEYQNPSDDEMKETYESVLRNSVVPGEIVTKTEKNNYTDSNRDKATVPAGFVISKIPEEQNVASGLVIYDIPENEIKDVDWTAKTEDGAYVVQTKYNQFVWVPVDINDMAQCEAAGGTCNLVLQTNGTLKCETHNSTNIVGKLYATTTGESFTPDTPNTIYKKDSGLREPDLVTDYDNNKEYNDGIFTLQSLKNEYKEMATSVAKYGGFYIGRYEMSLSTATSDSAGTEGTACSKAGVIPTSAKNTATYMWYGLYGKAKTYMVSQNSVQSSMIWGSQYDAMLKWVIDGKGEDASKVTDKSGIGNNSSGIVATTGKSAYSNDRINNIRDLAGNLREWTLEVNSTNTRVIRGR